MIEFQTIDIEQGDGQMPSIEQAAYLAYQHAQEATRLLNEFVVDETIANKGSRISNNREKIMSVAPVHAQISLAYAQLASALLQADRWGHGWAS